MKKAVWRHIRSERSHVTTPHEYSALAKQLCSNVQVEFIAKSVIDQLSASLDAIWKGVMAVPKTHRVYCIQASGADEVKVADTFNEIEKRFRVCRIRNTNVTTPQTNSTAEQDSPLEDNVQPSYHH